MYLLNLHLVLFVFVLLCGLCGKLYGMANIKEIELKQKRRVSYTIQKVLHVK